MSEAAPKLGPLEARIMQVLWSCEPGAFAPVRDVGRLRAVLDAYARIAHQRGRHAPELAGVLHKGDEVMRAEQQLVALVRDVLTAAVDHGTVRGDVPPAELASYCVNALAAANDLPSRAAVARLVEVTHGREDHRAEAHVHPHAVGLAVTVTVTVAVHLFFLVAMAQVPSSTAGGPLPALCRAGGGC